MMELILENTKIIDENFNDKIKRLIIDNNLSGENYELTIEFHADLLNSNEFEEYYENYVKNSNKCNESINDANLSYILEHVIEIFKSINIEVCESRILGNNIQSIDITKIIIHEKEKLYWGKGKNRCLVHASSIMPSLPDSGLSKVFNKDINETYSKMMNIVENKKLMSEILGFDEEQEHYVLFKEFANQYGELWSDKLTLGKDTISLKFCERALKVLEGKLQC